MRTSAQDGAEALQGLDGIVESFGVNVNLDGATLFRLRVRREDKVIAVDQDGLQAD